MSPEKRKTLDIDMGDVKLDIQKMPDHTKTNFSRGFYKYVKSLLNDTEKSADFEKFRKELHEC